MVVIDENFSYNDLERVLNQSAEPKTEPTKAKARTGKSKRQLNSPVACIRLNALAESSHIYVFVGSGKQNELAYMDIVLKNPDKEKRKDFSRFLKGISSHLEISGKQTYQLNVANKDDSGRKEVPLEVTVYDVHKGITRMRELKGKIDGVHIEEAVSSMNGDASLDARLKGIKDYFSGNAFYRLK